MNDPELRKLLERVHAEIQQTSTVDPEGRELLHDLEKDIHQLLERAAGEPLSQPGMIGRLEESITRFEVEHPDLTLLLSNILTTLSNAGI